MLLIAYLWLAAAALLLLYSVFLGKRISKLWLILTGIAPVVIVHVVNPAFRVWSFHSLMHGGIVYQILCGNIPPPAPLVGGIPLQYPWGAHLLAAGLCRASNTTPFTSFALVNLGSLLVSMVLAYKVSKILIDDEKANILSAVVAIFATSLGPGPLIQLLPEQIPVEFRGTPLLVKFINPNTLPLGAAFFLLFLYSALRLFRAGSLRILVLVAASVIGCGFFYAPFLPGIVAGAGLAFLLSAVMRLAGTRTFDLKRTGLLLAVVIGCVLVLKPYLDTAGGGITSQASLLEWEWVSGNVLRYLVVALPLLVVVFLSRSRLRAVLRRPDLLLFAAMISANLVCYFFIHLPFKGEYKFLLLSLVSLGILGGISFRTLLDRNRILVFAVLVLFLLPVAKVLKIRTTTRRSERSPYIERGIALHTAIREDEELYAWIRENAPEDAIFLDDELDIPALAQRQLYVPPERLWSRRRLRGYGFVEEILLMQIGYSSDLLEERGALLKHIYDPATVLSESELEELSRLPGPAYIVLRDRELKAKFNAGFEEVFSTAAGGYGIYKLPRGL